MLGLAGSTPSCESFESSLANDIGTIGTITDRQSGVGRDCHIHKTVLLRVIPFGGTVISAGEGIGASGHRFRLFGSSSQVSLNTVQITCDLSAKIYAGNDWVGYRV